jgi:hypothetical protein
MNKRLKNKLTMYKAVLSYLEQEEAIWQQNALFAQVVQEMKNLIEQIEATLQLTNTDNSGVVQKKTNIQNDLIDAAFILMGTLQVMAVRTGNTILQGKTNLTKSDFQRMPDEQLTIVCKNLIDLLKKNLNALAEYGVVAADVTDLETKLNSYQTSLPTHRMTVSERKAANLKLQGLTAEVDILLKKQLDLMAARFKKSHPDFYAVYLNDRKVVDYGIRHEKPEETEPAVVNS